MWIVIVCVSIRWKNNNFSRTIPGRTKKKFTWKFLFEIERKIVTSSTCVKFSHKNKLLMGFFVLHLDIIFGHQKSKDEDQKQKKKKNALIYNIRKQRQQQREEKVMLKRMIKCGKLVFNNRKKKISGKFILSFHA